MEDNYSIDEIISAVNDLQNIKKEKNNKFSKVPHSEFNNSDIPKNTLKLIEEAEKTRN